MSYNFYLKSFSNHQSISITSTNGQSAIFSRSRTRNGMEHITIPAVLTNTDDHSIRGSADRINPQTKAPEHLIGLYQLCFRSRINY